MTNPSVSPYSVFDGNPIANSDVLGNKPDFFQSLSKAANTAIGIYNAAKVAATVVLTVASKVDHTYKEMSPVQKQTARVTAEFMTGLGPEHRDFGPNDAITQGVASSNLTQAARQEFFKTNAAALTTGAISGDFSGVKDMKNEHMSFGLTGLFDKSGILQEGNNSAAQMVGSANYTISLSKDHKSLNFHVDDIKGRYSLLYHGIIPGTKEAAQDKQRGKTITPMGNATQSYDWSEPIVPQSTPKK